MRNIKEVFEKIQEQKREQREINKAMRESLDNSATYRDIKEQIENLRLKKLRMEDAAMGDLEQKADLLKLNIKEGMQVMSDIALTTIMKGESVKLVDSDKNEYEPVFSIRFKKTSNKSYDDKEEEKK